MTTRRMMLFIAALAGLIWSLDQGGVIADGAYKLRVTVAAPPVRSLFGLACGRKDEANGIAQMWMNGSEPSRIAEWDYLAEPFTGEPFEVRVQFGVHATGLGRVLQEGQMRALCIAVQYADGNRGFKIVEIPHRSVSRRVYVSFP